MLSCSWKEHFGIDCLTCGFQRSVKLLFSGEFWESFLTFPATIPFMATVLFALFYIWKGHKNGHRIIVGMFSFTALLIVINYSVKIATGSFVH